MYAFSGTSVPGIAECSDGTGDADAHVSATVKFRGKTDLLIHKGKLLGGHILLVLLVFLLMFTTIVYLFKVFMLIFERLSTF